MDILERIREYGRTQPEKIAVQSGQESLTYGQLENYSNRVAAYIEKLCGEDKSAVAVYGHKNPYMLVCFLALVKSGRGYCPIDISVPRERVDMILDALDSKICLAVEPMETSGKQVISLAEIKDAAQNGTEEIEADKKKRAVRGNVPGSYRYTAWHSAWRSCSICTL